MDDSLSGQLAAGRELARTVFNAGNGEEPSSPQAFVSRGTVLKSEGRLPEAAAILKQGIVRFPDADELINEYAWISHDLGDFTFGAVHWRHLRALAPNNLDGYLGGGLASRRASAFDAADRIYELGIERFPANPTLQVDYAWSAEERGDFNESARRWALVRERFPDNPEGVIRTGLSLLSAGQLTDAEIALERAVAQYPLNVEALTEYAWVAQLQRRWPIALARWEQIITHHPELPLPRRFGAVALMELGRYREAIAVLAPALRMQPDNVDLCVMQAWIATRSRGESSECLRLWERVRALAPDRLEGYHGAAAALIDAGRLDDADELLGAALERFPTQLNAATEWARLPERRERWSLAITRWETVLQRFPAESEPFWGLGNALMLGNRLSEAEAVLESGARQFPDDVRIAAAVASVVTRRSDWPRALMTWKAVKTRFPDLAIGYAGYGRTLRASGNLVGATHQLRQSVTRFPDDFELRLEFALSSSAQRDWPEALPVWEALRRDYPANRQLAAHITNIVDLAQADQALTDAPFTIPDVLIEAAQAGDVAPTDAAAVLARFESLGDSCEFAMVQRLYAVEHLSLLRWARTSPQNLTRALGCRLEGVGDPEHTLITRFGDEYITEDRRYGMRSHTFTSPAAEPLEEFAPEQCRRIRWLKDRLLSQLSAPTRIFVYTGQETFSAAAALALFEALRRYSERNRLLCVRTAQAGHPPGTLEELRPGLWMGYLDKLSTVDISISLWLTLCRAVLDNPA